LGLSWAVVQPLVQIVIFTIVFGKVAKVNTDGIPYFLFATVAVIPWNYMSQSMIQSSGSLVAGQGMLGKIYFPRLMFPITPILAKLFDFAISLLILVGVFLYYGIYPTWRLLLFPLVFAIMVAVPLGVGAWLSALAIRFRDVQYGLQFGVRMLIYSAPIVYSASSIPEKYRFIYSFNPIVGVIEGYRACFLGTPIPWLFIWPGIVTSIILVITGVLYFKRTEHIFVDVI
jgi:lipopolysaccharide transport system permease protein